MRLCPHTPFSIQITYSSSLLSFKSRLCTCLHWHVLAPSPDSRWPCLLLLIADDTAWIASRDASVKRMPSLDLSNPSARPKRSAPARLEVILLTIPGAFSCPSEIPRLILSCRTTYPVPHTPASNIPLRTPASTSSLSFFQTLITASVSPNPTPSESPSKLCSPGTDRPRLGAP